MHGRARGGIPGEVLPGVGSSQGWRFPRRESPRGLGPSDEPIKKHYAHIKEEFISPALHSARSTTSSSNQQRNYSQEQVAVIDNTSILKNRQRKYSQEQVVVIDSTRTGKYDSFKRIS